ncbi:MAG: universal stress protein [Nitrospirota bacterium]|jgi:nucleotide-binding universal stress UspA family protein
MRRVLIAVDDTKGAARAVEAFADLFADNPPTAVLLLHVQKLEGRSLMDEMLGEPELSTLKEQLKDTEYQEALNRRAQAVLGHARELLERRGMKGVRSLVREGHPAEEILKAAAEERADVVVVGSRGRRLHTLLMGSVSREVANMSDVPVFVAK